MSLLSQQLNSRCICHHPPQTSSASASALGRLIHRYCEHNSSVELGTQAGSGISGGNFVNLEPLVGAILGVSLLHEDLGIMALAGGALILGGAMYFSYKPERGTP
jgi:hypothetical protein